MNGGNRHGAHLRRRYRIILGYAGVASFPAAGILASPLLLLPAFPQEAHHAWGFLLPALAFGGVGLSLWRFLLPREGDYLTYPEAAVVVLLVWVHSILFSAFPFWTIGGLGFTRGLFESTSGWTTTGLSVMDVGGAPSLLLFFRSILQFAGGAGLAILMLSALAGPAGTGLSAAEGRAEQLLPQVRRSARLVLSIYLGYALAGWLALWLVGMNPFDAVNHAFTALSTGGFSTRPESIAAWDEPAIETVLMVLMLMGSVNFLTAYLLLRGRIGAVRRNGELHLLLVLLSAAAAVLFCGVTAGLYPALEKKVRIALFEAVSALTTTGYTTTTYRDWPDLGWAVLILLMVVGGGSGSTAGGFKQFRVAVLLRALQREIRRLLLPRQTVSEPSIWVGEQRRFLSDSQIQQVGVFLFFYLASLGAGTIVLCAAGHPLRESLFEMASALGTVGLSSGITHANSSAVVLWTEMAGMFFGRLEFFVIFIGLARAAADLPFLFGKTPKKAL